MSERPQQDGQRNSTGAQEEEEPQAAAGEVDARVQEAIDQAAALLAPRRAGLDRSLLLRALALFTVLAALVLLDLLSGSFSAWMREHAIVAGLITGGVLVFATALVVDQLVRRQERRKTDGAAVSAIDDLGAACAHGSWEILDVVLRAPTGSPVVTSVLLNDVILQMLSGAGPDAFTPTVSVELVGAARAVLARTKEIATRCSFLAGREDVQQLLVHYQDLATVLESLQSCGAFVLNDEVAAPERAAAWYGVSNAIALLPERASTLLADANEARARRFLLGGRGDDLRRSVETQMHADLIRDGVYRKSIEWEASLGPGVEAIGEAI